MRGISKNALAGFATMTAVAAGVTVVVSAAAAETHRHHYYHHTVYQTRADAPPTTYPGSKRPRGILPRDRTASPPRGNPDKTPVNATTLPF
jgi:hypothetical protein